MLCPLQSEQSAAILLDYSARRLDPALTELLESHMGMCSECARFRDEQSAVWTALDTWEPEPVTLEFNRTLWARIEEEQPAGFWSAGCWKPIAGVALAAVALIAVFLLDLRHA